MAAHLGWYLLLTCLLSLAIFLSDPTSAQAATYTVNSELDEIDAHPGDGLCVSMPSAVCTMGAAVAEANANPDVDTIKVPAGTYSQSPASQMVFTSNVNVVGSGADVTIIDGSKTVTISRGLRVSQGVQARVAGLSIEHYFLSSTCGAGVWNDGDLTLDGVVIRQTGTDFTGAAGGGICNSGTLTVTNSTLTGNGSKQGGAILNGRTGIVTIRNSTLSKNNISGSTPAIGTAILNGGMMTITDSTITENIFNNGAGGAIVSNGGIISIANSIISFNGTSHLPQVHNCEGLPLISLGHNLDDDGSCGFTAAGDLSNIPSRLGPLSDNGGPTPTHLPLIGSQVIDAGAGCLATDQRGVARPRDGDGNGTALCDIGAVEGPARGVLQFSGVTYNVSEAGATASITVTRINGAEGPTSAAVSMTNGTATAPADYDATSLPVAFSDGDSTAKMVQVPIVDDPNDEPDETVNLALGPANAANIGALASAVLTISDNDNPPSLFIGDVSIAEGDAGPVSAEFPVTLSVASGFTVTVVAQTTDGTATAASGDYQVAGPDTLTFAPGTTMQPFTVQVNADAIDELNETFAVNLSAPMNATIADNQGQGTISDDDVPGSLGFSATTAQVAENAGLIILTVQRGGVSPSGAGPPAANVPSGSVRPNPVASPVPDRAPVDPSAISAVTVSYATANGSALAGEDYTATSGTLTFGVNETTRTLVVPLVVDGVPEPNETFSVTLSNPTGGATIAQATISVTILGTLPSPVTPSPVPPSPTSSPGDDDTDKPKKETEDERRQRARTNRGNKDDESTEGNVIETRCDQPWPSVVIANRDGLVEVRLLKDARSACTAIQVGDYLEVDGQKQHEALFDADSVEIRRNGERVR